MRLLFFSSMRGAPWGGSEELWAAAAREAIRAGHDVCVCVFDWRPRAGQVEDLERLGAKVITRPLRPSRLSGLVGQAAWLRELDAFDPDAICLSQGSAYECVGRRSTRPLLAWLEKRRGQVVNLVQFNEPKRNLKAGTHARAVRLFELGTVNGFVAERNIREASQTLGWEVPRSRVVRNPVNLADPSELPWPVGEPRFGCVGRLHVDAKGQDLLLEVLGREAWRARGWRLSLLGAGTDEGVLREQAARQGIADRVVFAGSTADIRGVWKEHHLLVLPSRAEGTPLAMVEAMLLGRPCMVTDVGGCTEWVRDGVEGWVARTASVNAIGAAMERAWGDRAKWREMGAAARRRAMELWDPNPGQTILELLTTPDKAPAKVR